MNKKQKTIFIAVFFLILSSFLLISYKQKSIEEQIKSDKKAFINFKNGKFSKKDIASLKGKDYNFNGIRDDIEINAFLELGEDETGQKILLAYGRLYQEEVEFITKNKISQNMAKNNESIKMMLESFSLKNNILGKCELLLDKNSFTRLSPNKDLTSYLYQKREEIRRYPDYLMMLNFSPSNKKVKWAEAYSICQHYGLPVKKDYLKNHPKSILKEAIFISSE